MSHLRVSGADPPRRRAPLFLSGCGSALRERNYALRMDRQHLGIRGRLTLACSALLGVALIALLGAGDARPAVGVQPGGVYIALGDSYTSGPLVPMQQGEPIDCGRSDHNYPSLVAAEFKPETFIDVSCGSAETKHMTEPQTDLPAGGTNPPQFDALRADATLVTVGIGGNDAGLVAVATECAQLGATQPTGTACRDRYAPGGNDLVAAEIEATKPKIAGVIEGIHKRSPKARVAIVGYPDVLPDSGNCYPMVPLSPDDVRYIDELIIRINTMIEEQAAKHDADFVDTYAGSGGHDVCKLPPERWFEGLVPTEPAYPLHPNAKGLASMGRSAIKVLSKPSKRAPAISEVRLAKRKVRSGRPVTLRYRLDRNARVDLTLRRRGRSGGGKTTEIPAFGSAGPNRYVLSPNRYVGEPGRYRLTALPTDNGLTGRPAKVRFRVVRRSGDG